MDDQQLQKWVEQISLQYFQRPFRHRATFNRRLKTTGGRYFPATHHIEISWLQYVTYGESEVEKIIKHELCHYHLHLMQKGYRHRDADFKEWLRRVGGSRHCRPIPGAGKKERWRYLLRCTGCGMEYRRKRKIDPSRYVCGICRGKLRVLPLDSPSGGYKNFT